MPYIKQGRASLMDGFSRPQNAGELNFLITNLITDYINRAGLKYQSLVEVTGVLTHVQQEMYRRVVAPYEDTKIAENGDVYPPELLSSEWEPAYAAPDKITYSQDPRTYTVGPRNSAWNLQGGKVE